ncbi:MAG: hypothetical protein SGI88_11750 [Candidatus Hydrogenedentes bacterium]|nr:hypothetical protein [Candidatus Hydrogenedentota bacterium]
MGKLVGFILFAIVVAAVVAAIVVAAIVLGKHFGFGSGSSSNASESAEGGTATSTNSQGERPLKVRIEGGSYLSTDGDKLSLDQVAERAKLVPAGTGPAVLVERGDTSTAIAEQELEAILRSTGISMFYGTSE